MNNMYTMINITVSSFQEDHFHFTCFHLTFCCFIIGRIMSCIYYDMCAFSTSYNITSMYILYMYYIPGKYNIGSLS